tara:strand:+ start:1912 stop:5427 length:3516 start_codon:yes stop_codon:yes gene_type:complete
MAEVLSPYSRIFSNVNTELENLVESGQLQSNQEKIDFVKSKGLDIKAFTKAQDEYYTLLDEGKGESLAAPGSAIGRTILGAVGKAGEGVEQIGEAFFPKTTEAIKEKIQLPEAIERKRQELFFPTQDTEIEKTATEIGSYLIPGGVAFKGLSLGAKGLKLAKASKKANIAKGTTAFAIGTTVVEKPENNFVNFLSDELVTNEAGQPIGTVGQLAEKLKVNPDDEVTAQYLRSFVNNLILEGAFVGVGAAAIKGISKLPIKDFVNYVITGTKKAVDYITPTNVKEFAKKYGTSRMGLTDKGLDIVLEKNAATKFYTEKAQILTKQLKKSINKEIPKASRTDETMEAINAALAGDKRVLQSIEQFAPDTAKVIDNMRSNIDELSEIVKDDIAQGTLRTTIDDNLETYVNRSYRIFDDPSYLKNIPEEAKEGAYKYFKGLQTKDGKRLLTDAEIDEVYKHYTEGMAKGEFNSFIKGISAQANQVLKQRKDIPVEIRNLWGEVKDPYRNYVNTYTKLGNIVAEQKFKKEIAEEALNAKKAQFGSIPGFKKVTQTPEGEETFLQASNVGLGGIRSNLNNPLEGLFLDPVWKEAIEQGIDLNLKMQGPLGKGLRGWMAFKAASQAAKTIYSIPTHGRNIMGNFFIMAANGTVNPMTFGKAFKTTAKRYTGKMSPEEQERLARYVQLGIVDSSVTASALRKAAGEGFEFGPNGMIDKALTKSGAKFLNRKTLQLYEAEDNLFKIANFENLLKSYRKSFPNLTEEQLEKFVAQRSRDMMPNYNLVPKALKFTRALPIGNFVAFPAEMARNAKNLMKYAWQDISGKTARDMGITDPKAIANLRKIGLKRLAGMTTVALAGDEAVERSKALFGISDEQEAALNQTLPEWEKGTNKIFLSPIKDVNGELKVDYINMGPIDPYSYLKVPVKILSSAIINNQDYNERTIDDMYNQAFYSVIAPYADPSLSVQAMLDTYKGKGAVADEGKIPKLARVLARSITPGTVDFFFKRKQYLEGEGKSTYGFDIPAGAVDIPAFFGVKRSTANLSQGLSFNTNKIIRDMNRSKQRYRKEIGDFTGGDRESILNSYKQSQKNKLEHAQRLRNLIKSYRALGMDDSYIANAITRKGFASAKNFKEIKLADQNIFMPDFISKSDILKGLESGADIPIQEITEIQRLLSNSEID